MIYLEADYESWQDVYIPRNTSATLDGDITLTLFGTVTRGAVLDGDHVVDENDSDIYHHILVSLSGMETTAVPGEYEYALAVDGDVMSTGLLTISDTDAPTQYETTTTYTQYEQ